MFRFLVALNGTAVPEFFVVVFSPEVYPPPLLTPDFYPFDCKRPLCFSAVIFRSGRLVYIYVFSDI